MYKASSAKRSIGGGKLFARMQDSKRKKLTRERGLGSLRLCLARKSGGGWGRWRNGVR